MKQLKPIYRVLESFKYTTKDVNDVLNKEWLKTAIISHIQHDTGYPKEYIEKIVELIYLTPDL